MKKIAVSTFMLLCFALAGCGGGGANIGVTTPTTLQISPASLTLTGSATKCPSGAINANFYVTGGQPPYSIKPALPDVTVLNTTMVGADGGFFTVTALDTNSCLSAVAIVVEDQTGAVVQATITTTTSQ